MSKYDYDVAVIGGGSAGLTAAGIAASVAAKTIMIEASELGGDCTWTGCIPSKALIHMGSLARKMKDAEEFGAEIKEPIDLKKAFNYVRKTRQEVWEDADDPEIFRNMGIDVRYARAAFKDAHTLSLTDNNTGETSTITAKYIFICTGSHAASPPIPGLDSVDHLTNENLFELEEMFESLTIIGAGPIGIEMAQALHRLGVEVTVLDMSERILQNDDEEIAEYLEKYLREEGVNFRLGVSVDKVENAQDGSVITTVSENGKEETLLTDKILVAAGRAPSIDGLNLNDAGVEYSKRGIQVNDFGRTNVKNIYAVGDVAGRYQFTHMADHMAKIAVTRALMKIPMKFDEKHVVWATYSDPELAHVGSTRKMLDEEGISYEVYKLPYTKVDRALTDGDDRGWIHIYAKKISGKILGATVLGANGAELISEYAVAMRNGVSLRKLADTIHPYPSYGLGARRAADQWYIKSQSLGLVKFMKAIFGYQGELPDLSDPDRIV